MTPTTIEALQTIIEALQTIIAESGNTRQRAAIMRKASPLNLARLKSTVSRKAVFDGVDQLSATELRKRSGCREWARLLGALNLQASEPNRLDAEAALRSMDIWFEGTGANNGRMFFNDAHAYEECPWYDPDSN